MGIEKAFKRHQQHVFIKEGLRTFGITKKTLKHITRTLYNREPSVNNMVYAVEDLLNSQMKAEEAKREVAELRKKAAEEKK